MARCTVGGYLLRRLRSLGVRHVFGVPGDYNLQILDQIAAIPGLAWIGACNELNASYAADGYARIGGLGALVTTFGVGELSALNGIAGAYAESVPVVAVAGAPATATQRSGALLHHTLGGGDFAVFARMAAQVTAAQTALTPENARAEIDRVLGVCLSRRAPVYLALPMDVAVGEVDAPADPWEPPAPRSDPFALAAAVEAVVGLLKGAHRPAVLAGPLIDRWRLREPFRELLAATGYPCAVQPMAKGLLEETHPQFAGIYIGALSDEPVRRRVEDADCLLCAGTLMTDFNTGGFSAVLDAARTIEVRPDAVTVRGDVHGPLLMADALAALGRRLRPPETGAAGGAGATPGSPGPHPFVSRHAARFEGSLEASERDSRPAPGAPITHRRLWPRLARFLRPGDVVLADIGTPLFGTVQMPLPAGAVFVAQSLWASIGYSVPAAVGCALAAPERRVVVLIGDGSFQVTAQELSTLARCGARAVIVLLNNAGYTIERAIHAPGAGYHDVGPWRYADLPEALGTGGWGARAATEGDLDNALGRAAAPRGGPALIEVLLDPLDVPDLLARFGRR